jgi:hypothetical protein
MFLFDILKNPIVIGLIGFVIAYLYLYYQNKKKIDPETNQPQKVSIAKPLIVGLILWFVANNVLTPDGKRYKGTDSESLVETSENTESESMKDVLSGISAEATDKLTQGLKKVTNLGDKKNAKVFTDVANF